MSYILLSGPDPEGPPAAEEHSCGEAGGLRRAVCCTGAMERPLSAGGEHILAPRASHGGDCHRASRGGAGEEGSTAVVASTPTGVASTGEGPHGRCGSASRRAPRNAVEPRAAAAGQRAEQRRLALPPAPSEPGSPPPKPPEPPSTEASTTESGVRVGWRVGWRNMRGRGSSGGEPRNKAKEKEEEEEEEEEEKEKEEEESGFGRHSRCFSRLHLDRNTTIQMLSTSC